MKILSYQPVADAIIPSFFETPVHFIIVTHVNVETLQSIRKQKVGGK